MTTTTYVATIPATGETDTTLSGSKVFTHAVVFHQIDRPAFTVLKPQPGIQGVTYWQSHDGWRVKSFHTTAELAEKAAAALLRRSARKAAELKTKYGVNVPAVIDHVEVVEVTVAA
jgi:hypothetical protein